MIIDIIKIGKIKKKSQLKRYSVNKPLFNNNYLFHYLIISNNIEGLKLATFPVNMVNDDNYNGFMLAAYYNNYKILYYYIKTYPQYIYLKNNNNMNFLHFLAPTDIKYFDMIIQNKNIKWDELFSCYSTLHISPLDNLFINGKYKVIIQVLKFLNTINFDYSKYQSQPSFFNLFNNSIDSEHVIKILDTIYNKDNKIFTYVDDMGYDISFIIVLKNDITMVKYIIEKCGESLDKYSPLMSNNIFTIAYSIGIKNNDIRIAKLLYHTMKNHDYNETDMNGNNIAHFILLSRIKNNKGDYSLEKSILSRVTDWSKMNMKKQTLLDLITLLDFNRYHKFVKQINNISYKKMKIANIKWKKYIMKLPKLKNRNKKIVMIEAPYTHSNMFQAHFTDIAIFCFYLKNKYKNLYLPQYKGKSEISWNDDIILPDDLLKNYNNFPWLIIWNNSSNFWIHPELNNLINKNKDKYDYAFVILSLRLSNDGLHATLILYDFKRKIVERFDPYGNTTILDKDMDNKLEEELTRNTGLKYISPSVYFPVSGFQTISDETNTSNTKLGDFGGYCLAWCFWYVEHRLLNYKVAPTLLVRKTLNRFMEMNIKPIEYIRNYANSINRYRFKFYKKNDIGINIASDENIKITDRLKIFKSIIKENAV